MVTKPNLSLVVVCASSVLAKILMVTKHLMDVILPTAGSVLAKILMVTKPESF